MELLPEKIMHRSTPIEKNILTRVSHIFCVLAFLREQPLAIKNLSKEFTQFGTLVKMREKSIWFRVLFGRGKEIRFIGSQKQTSLQKEKCFQLRISRFIGVW